MEILKFYAHDGFTEYLMCGICILLIAGIIKLWCMANSEETMIEYILNRIFMSVGVIVVFFVLVALCSYFCYIFQTVIMI